ncbi:MAG: hypothetical protein IIA55_12635 [Gemmatimonadetes bacterium]|nr:hypothetical protein [Gemmatimonadota bacterium]
MLTRIQVAEVVDEAVREDMRDLLVLSHDCEIAKPDNHWVLCARIRTIDSLDSSNAGHVRSGHVLNTMHLPATVGDVAEAFVDFRMIHRLRKDALLRAVDDGRRVTSMSDDGRLTLVSYLYRYFARKLPA